jgi:FMN phosphatase YigB (HAD superfamily)
MLKVLAFDCFGTIFDMSGVDRSEVSDYVKSSKGKSGDEWLPLSLPRSWYQLRAHPDSAEGIRVLRSKYICVALSNGPVDLITEISRLAGIDWDLIVPIQLRKVYKDHLDAYRILLELYPYEAGEFAMVTANPGFGDVEAASSLGMKPIVIRGESSIKNTFYLNEMLDRFERI